MRKGLTPIIAIILLLIIVISIAGFSFLFFQGLQKSSEDSTKSQLNATTKNGYVPTRYSLTAGFVFNVN